MPHVAVAAPRGDDIGELNSSSVPEEIYVYVEIGALDGILYSNTLHLHTCLGWRGVPAEGNRANYEQLVINVQRTRPEAEVHWGAVCGQSSGVRELHRIWRSSGR